MTLPRLLAQALREHTGDNRARYVFPVRVWTIESAASEDSRILTLWTVDGFEVSLGITLEFCRALGMDLVRAADPTPTQ